MDESPKEKKQMETKNVTEEEVRKSVQSGDGREFEIEEEIGSINTKDLAIRNEEENKMETKQIEEFREKLVELVTEYINKGLDLDDIRPVLNTVKGYNNSYFTEDNQ